MDRKKIYIGIILVCFLATIGVLYYSFSGSSNPPTPTVVTQAQSSSTTDQAVTPINTGFSSSPTGEIIYKAPPVFPSDSKFDWTLLDSAQYKNFVSNPVVTLDPGDVGRDDSFKPY